MTLSKLGLSVALGFGLLISSRGFAQLPQPNTVDQTGQPPAVGVGGRIPDAEGKMIDHTFDAVRQRYGGFSSQGFGGAAGLPSAGTGSRIPDVEGNLVDHTYNGPPVGQQVSNELYGLGAGSSSFGLAGTGIFGGGRTQGTLSSQGFYQFTNRYGGQGSTNGSNGSSFGNSSLTQFNKRTVSPYLNLANTRGAGAIRYYGLVKPQFQAESQFKTLGDRVSQNSDAVRSDAAVRALEEQMRAVVRNERVIQSELRSNSFSANPGGDRFRALVGQAAAPQSQEEQLYEQRLSELANLIQSNGLGVKAEPPARPPLRLPSSTGGPLPNFGNTSHYYNNQNANVPNLRLGR